jgi:hypothetical protein
VRQRIKRPRVIPFTVSRPIAGPPPVSLKSVRDAVAGKPSSLSRVHAMALLRSSNYPGAYRELEALLVNEREPREIRLLAAANLGKIDRPAVVEILTANLAISDDAIRSVILTVLGRIGHHGVLELLERASREDTGSARTAAAFALTLLSHRLGLSGHELSLPRDGYVEPHVDGGVPIDLRRANDADAEQCLRGLAQKPLGIELSPDHVYQVQMWRRIRMVLLNRQYATADGASRLQRQSAFLGVVAAADPETGVYYPTRALLTSPGASRSAVNVFLCRLRGEVLLAGGSTVAGDRDVFTLRSVAQPGARPMRIEGVFDKGELRFTNALAATRVIDKRQSEVAHG